jgi:hypothetical protein
MSLLGYRHTPAYAATIGQAVDYISRRLRFVRHNAANETTPCSLADESAAFERLAQGGAALSAVATGSGSFSSDQATTRSACSTLPLVSGASTSERAKLSAPTQVPIIMGIA